MTDFRKSAVDNPLAGSVLEGGFGIDFEARADGGPAVKVEHFISSLADRTGATDATNAFTDKIAQVAADYGGGAVGYPAGTFLVDQIQLKNGVWLVSQDGHKGIIKQNANQFTVMDSGTSSGSNGASTFNDTTKAWGAVNQYRDYTIEILAGTGSGQIRLIASHTATQLSIETPWTVTPNGTSTYRILRPKHLINLDNAANEFCGIVGGRLDGNKANQKSHNDLINLINTTGGPTLFDTHHVVRDVLGLNPKGNGITIGANVREARIINLTVQGGGRYGKYTSFQGGTDNWFIDCTFASCALTGVSAGGTNDKFVAVKAFGNGVDNISGNGAGFIISQPCIVSACESQENRQRGFHFLNINAVIAQSIVSDANGGEGILLDNSFDNQINAIVKSGAGLAYQTNWAINVINGADRNNVLVNARSAEFAGGLIDPTGQWNPDNRIDIQERMYGREFNVGRTVAAAVSDEHYVVSKQGAPATNNPYFAWKTDAGNPPKSAFVGYDGTSTKTFIQLDFANGKLILGDTGSSVVVELSSIVSIGSIIAGGVISSKYGTKGSTTDEHFRFGKTSSPAAANPYYVFKTDASTTPIGSLQGWDLTSAKTFMQFDYGGSKLILGDASITSVNIVNNVIMTASTSIYAGSIATANLRIFFDTTALYLRGGTGGIQYQSSAGANTVLISDTGVLNLNDGVIFVSGKAIYSSDTATAHLRIQINDTSLVLRSGTSGYTFQSSAAATLLTISDAGIVGAANLIGSNYGTKGSTSNEHFRFAKSTGGGATGDPYYVWKTDAAATPVATFSGWDGTTAKVFMQCDYGNARLIVPVDVTFKLDRSSGTSAAMIIAMADGVQGTIEWQHVTSKRWIFGADGGVEGTGAANNGNDFFVACYDDSAGFLRTPFKIRRQSPGGIVQSAPSSAETDSYLGNSTIHFWIDETNNKLKVKAKYSSGTVKNLTSTATFA